MKVLFNLANNFKNINLKLYNTHTHKLLNDKNDVTQILNLDLYKATNLPENNYFSAGIHPCQENYDNVDWYLQVLNKLVKHQNCVAVGECGLDFKVKTDRSLQILVFEKQIDIAKKFNLPLIIHCVAAYNELIILKKSNNSQIPWIIHGFFSNEEILKNLITHNFNFSVGKNLVLKKPYLLHKIPLNKLFIETDESEIPIKELYSKIASELSISILDLQKQIETNFNNCFIIKR